jgi:hypothetical protein
MECVFFEQPGDYAAGTIWGRWSREHHWLIWIYESRSKLGNTLNHSRNNLSIPQKADDMSSGIILAFQIEPDSGTRS